MENTPNREFVSADDLNQYTMFLKKEMDAMKAEITSLRSERVEEGQALSFNKPMPALGNGYNNGPSATSTESSVKNSTTQGFDDDFASGFSSSTTSSSSTEATIIDQQHSPSISQSGTISNDADFETTPAPLKKPFGALSKPGGGLAAPPPPAASSKKKAMMAKAKTTEGGT